MTELRKKFLKSLTKLLRDYLLNATIDLTPYITQILTLLDEEEGKKRVLELLQQAIDQTNDTSEARGLMWAKYIVIKEEL